MRPQRILIFGTGVVGQVFGGLLHRAGHLVTFYTRPDRVTPLRERGVRLLLRKGRTLLELRGLQITDEILLFDEFDLVFVCVRGDQWQTAEEALRRHKIGPAHIVWCMPLWPQAAAGLAARVPRSHLLLPGIAGLFRDDHIEVSLGTNRIAPLGTTPAEDARAIADLLSAAGLRTRLRPGLPDRLAPALAIFFPLLTGLAAVDFQIARLRRDDAQLRRVHAAQREALGLIEAAGSRLGMSARAYRGLPAGFFAYTCRFALLLVPRFGRDMLEIHFRKTRAQQSAMLRDLCRTASSAAGHAVLDRLLDDAELKRTP